MSTDTQEMPSGTQPLPEHGWLKKLVGNWKVESTMMMPDGSTATGTGSESVVEFGPLWVHGEGSGTMPGGDTMSYKTGLGFDVTFRGYRGFWMADVSSHLWKYEGELSDDGRVMTLRCVGPNMMVDGETANYKDVIEIVDDNHRTLTSYGEQENGEWMEFMKATFTRV